MIPFSGRPFQEKRLRDMPVMQLLFERTRRAARPRVVGAARPGYADARRKVPHMGWNSLRCGRRRVCGTNWQAVGLFVHSYRAEPTDPAIVLATTRYGRRFVQRQERLRVRDAVSPREKWPGRG